MGDINSVTRYTPPLPDPSLPPINVLTEVRVDPQGLSLIGRYDPIYPTGGIPYAALFATALNYQHPGFDLEPFIPEQTEKAISRDVARRLDDSETVRYLGGLILAYPDLQEQVVAALPDEIGLETRRAMALGFATCFSQGKTDCSDSVLDSLSSSESSEYGARLMMPIVLEKAGFKQVSDALRAFLVFRGSILTNEIPDDFYSKIKGLSGEQQVRFILAELATGLGLQNPTASVNRAMASQEEMRALQERIKQRVEELFIPAATEMVKGAFTHLVLSAKDMAARYGDLGYVTPRFIGMPPDSHLARILFEADYQTKFFDQLNARLAVPNHKDWEEFPYVGGQPGLETGMTMTFVPDKVQVAYDGSRANSSQAKFGEAKLRLSCVYPADQGRADAYCGQVNQRFNDYAHAFPSLHAAREAMKVVALAPWLKQQGVTAIAEDHSWTPPIRVAPEAGMHFYSPANSPTSRVTASIEGGVDFTQVTPTIISGAAVAFTDASLFDVAIPRGTYAPLPQDPTLTVTRLGLKIDPESDRPQGDPRQSLVTGIQRPPKVAPTEGSSPSLRADPGFGTLRLFRSPTKIEVPEPGEAERLEPISGVNWHVNIDYWRALGRFAIDDDIAGAGFPKAALGIGLINALRENTESFAWRLFTGHEEVVDGRRFVRGVKIETNWFDSWLSQQAESVTGLRPKQMVIPIGASLPGGKWNQAQLFISADRYRSAYFGIDSQGQLVLYPMWEKGDYLVESPGSADLIPLESFGHYGLPTGLPAAALLESQAP